jgi:hypothetical protein
MICAARKRKRKSAAFDPLRVSRHRNFEEKPGLATLAHAAAHTDDRQRATTSMLG